MTTNYSRVETEEEIREKRAKQWWEDAARMLGSNLLDEVTTERYGMEKHHPPEDIPARFLIEIKVLLTQQKQMIIEEIQKLPILSRNPFLLDSKGNVSNIRTIIEQS